MRALGVVIILGLWLLGVSWAATKKALIVTDVQLCLLENVTNGGSIINSINLLRQNNNFDVVVLTQLQYCPNHIMFTSQHSDVLPFSQILLTYNENNQLCPFQFQPNSTASPNCGSSLSILRQTVWPNHCVQNSNDSAMAPALLQSPTDIVISRGSQCSVGFYSAFFDNLGNQSTGLSDILKSNGVSSIFLSGFGYDTAIYYTARDARKLGFRVYAIQDAYGAVLRSSVTSVTSDLLNQGVVFITSDQIQTIFQIEDSNVLEKSLPPLYTYLDQLSSWDQAAAACLPNRLCTVNEYCPSQLPIGGVLSPGVWAPVYDAHSEWIYLGPSNYNTVGTILPADTCATFSSVYSFKPNIIQVPTGIPILCCGTSSTPTPTPTPVSTPPVYCPNVSVPAPSPRVHVTVSDDQVDSQPQVTRVALIACLCLGLGVTSGIAVGCFFGRKGETTII